MLLSEIQDVWKEDAKIDKTDLGVESLKVPQLHSKYYKIFSAERTELRRMEKEFAKLLRLKHEYYTGAISKETLDEMEWEPNPLRILRQDLSIYIESDKDICSLKQSMDEQEEKVNFLDSVIKSIMNRGFLIKGAIDWVKFTQGAL